MSREQSSRFKKKKNCKITFHFSIESSESQVVRLTGIGVFERVESVESVLMNMATVNECGTRRRLFFLSPVTDTTRLSLFPLICGFILK